MKKTMILLALALAWASMGMAQDYTMVVHLSDGTSQAYDVADVDSVSFADNYINGHEAVDLGLSVKWATMNVGASSITYFGNYYAWGETVTKDEYTKENSVAYGVELDDISGNAAYDAATANWGGSWRLPTKAEAQELVDSCTWEWATQDEVDGYLVTGPSGNAIFLPAAGGWGSSLSVEGSDGFYWTSSPYVFSADYAYGLHFDASTRGVGWMSRSVGRSVRPVSD